jgi:hypothetical protein
MKKYEKLYGGPESVADWLEILSTFPSDWPVTVKTPAGGGIGIEHREYNGRPFVAIFGKNGGRFGENPLTEEEYQKKSKQFLEDLSHGYQYTSVHGDHRTYLPDGPFDNSQATCYGAHYDRRIIERMVKEGLIKADSVDIERVAYFDRDR